MAPRKSASRQAAAFRHRMIALQREVFVRNQERIDRAVHGYNTAYRKYEREYHQRVQKYERSATWAELLDRILLADVIYVGDYHTLRQAQRTVLRLLRHLPLELRPTLAVEFVEGRYQKYVDDFLLDKISTASFLKKIKHDPGGVFAWDHFRPMFEFAQNHRMPMVGIDLQLASQKDSLRRRDEFASQRIAEAIAARPKNKVIVHIGELHISPNHLPRLVDRELKRRKLGKVKSLVVYQNCEEIYWQLEARGLEHDVEVVKVSNDEFCVINTPPIVCQQSFLNWLDADDELFDDTAPEKIFREYVEIICRVLDINVGDALDSLLISSVVDAQFLDILRTRGRFSKRELEQIHRLIQRSESHFVAKANMVYLGQLSINHAAEEAARFIRHVCVSEDEPRSLVDAFYLRVLDNAVGFLGSKLVNHKRKCQHERDFQRILRTPYSSKEDLDPKILQLAHYVVQHRRMEKGLRTRGLRHLYATDADMFSAVTRALGEMLGDKIYYALIEGVLTKKDVRELFVDTYEDEGAALAEYLTLSARTERVKLPRRYQ